MYGSQNSYRLSGFRVYLAVVLTSKRNPHHFPTFVILWEKYSQIAQRYELRNLQIAHNSGCDPQIAQAMCRLSAQSEIRRSAQRNLQIAQILRLRGTNIRHRPAKIRATSLKYERAFIERRAHNAIYVVTA